MASEPYNPLAKIHLAESIQRRFLAGPVLALGNQEQRGRARGAGVYALYYSGTFSPYRPIAQRNVAGAFTLPIYVGKAIPPGGRVGGIAQAEQALGALRDRLRRHAQSIDQTDNLALADFYFRNLVVDDIWIPLGENMLIETFRPLWNSSLSGFGSNPTGGPRSAQASSLWDTLHPGRAGAGQAEGSALEHALAVVDRYCRALDAEEGSSRA